MCAGTVNTPVDKAKCYSAHHGTTNQRTKTYSSPHNSPSRPQSGRYTITSALHGNGWATPRPGRFTPWEVTRYRKMGKAPGLVWPGAELLARTTVRSPDRPVRLRVAVPTTLSRGPKKVHNSILVHVLCWRIASILWKLQT
jgi:hypothetical protein